MLMISGDFIDLLWFLCALPHTYSRDSPVDWLTTEPSETPHENRAAAEDTLAFTACCIKLFTFNIVSSEKSSRCLKFSSI